MKTNRKQAFTGVIFAVAWVFGILTFPLVGWSYTASDPVPRDPIGIEVGPTFVGTGQIFPTYVDLEIPGRGMPFVLTRTYQYGLGQGYMIPFG